MRSVAAIKAQSFDIISKARANISVGAELFSDRLGTELWLVVLPLWNYSQSKRLLDTLVPHTGCSYNLFCSTNLPPTSTRWFDQRINTPHSKECRQLISATSTIWKNSWERRESNLGLLGEKRKCYLCAMPPPLLNRFIGIPKSRNADIKQFSFNVNRI